MTKASQTEKKTLENIGRASRFNRWMFSAIHPFLTGRVLEIGSGIGNISQLILEHGYELSLSDVQVEYVNTLKQKFSSISKHIFQCDIASQQFEENYKDLFQQYNTIIALNVIEHIQDDELAFQNISSLLKPSGKCIILVPAFQWLFCPLDTMLNHKTRYTRQQLHKLAQQNGLIVHKSFFFNVAGIFPWFVCGKLARQKQITHWQMQWYNFMVPLLRIKDLFFNKFLGLSIIAVYEKSPVHIKSHNSSAL